VRAVVLHDFRTESGGVREVPEGEGVTCLYCDAPVTAGPCIRDGLACNHEVLCDACKRRSCYSVNLALTGACIVRADELPLFRELSA
jgi:hypothetical protein